VTSLIGDHLTELNDITKDKLLPKLYQHKLILSIEDKIDISETCKDFRQSKLHPNTYLKKAILNKLR